MEENFCMGCMEPIRPGERICPHCGWNHLERQQAGYALPQGTILHAGKYLVGKILGQGGFGITYLGMDLTLRRKVAIKEYFLRNMASRSGGVLTWHIPAEEQEKGRENFVREARKMAKIDEIPGVVQVWEVFFENGTAYIVMKFVEGITLKERLRQRGTMDLKQCLALLRPVMDALSEAHRYGIIHRDVSPDNIMIDTAGKVWLLDLGAAKELDVEAAGDQSTHMVVRHGFSPLEQYTGTGKIGPWTDVYAMSATIAYCLSGKLLPLSTDRLFGPPLQLPDSIPPAVANVLTMGLGLRPEDRIQSMEKLRTALDRAAERPYGSGGGRPYETETAQFTPVSAAVGAGGYESGYADAAGGYGGSVGGHTGADYGGNSGGDPDIPDTGYSETSREAGYDRAYHEDGQDPIGAADSQPGKAANRAFYAAIAAVLAIAVLLVVFRPWEAGKPVVNPDPVDEVEQTEEQGGEQAVQPEPVPEPEPDPIVARGTFGANGTWTLDRDGLLTISGSGAVPDFADVTGPDSNAGVLWWDHQRDIKTVYIENGITGIGANAFNGCTKLTEIAMPASVTAIGNSAFRDCTGLQTAQIPGSVKEIGGAAFFGCTSLTSISVPDGVQRVGGSAFEECGALKTASIPGSVTQMGGRVFRHCGSLTEAAISARIESLPDRTFSGCSKLKTVSLPEKVKQIEYGAFYDCASLECAALPAGIESIGEIAYKNCGKLNAVVTPVEDTNPCGVIFPETLSSVGPGAFQGCPSLTGVFLPDRAATASDSFNQPVAGETAKEHATRTVVVPTSLLSNRSLSAFAENCSSRYFDREEVEAFGSNELLFARNAIYARSGQIFRSSAILKTYFSRFGWYSPKSEPDALNDYQNANLALAVAADYKAKTPGRSADPNTLLRYYVRYCAEEYFTEDFLKGYDQNNPGFDAEMCRKAHNALYARSGVEIADQNLHDYFVREFSVWGETYSPEIEVESFDDEYLNTVQTVLFNRRQNENFALLESYTPGGFGDYGQAGLVDIAQNYLQTRLTDMMSKLAG